MKEPYFNEAGYESQRGVSSGINRSRWYNEMVCLNILLQNFQQMSQPKVVLTLHVLYTSSYFLNNKKFFKQ